MEKYVVKIDSVTSDGIKLHDEKPFKIGELKGELLGVSAKNVHQGQKAEFTATVRNIGNLDLSTSFKIILKDEKGEKIFPETCSLIIPPESGRAYCENGYRKNASWTVQSRIRSKIWK